MDDGDDLRRSADEHGLGAALRRRRRELGLTQEDLAALASVGVRLVHELEHGATATRLDGVLRVLSALGLHLELGAGSSPSVVVPAAFSR